MDWQLAAALHIEEASLSANCLARARPCKIYYVYLDWGEGET